MVGVGLNRGVIAPKDIPEDARKILEGAFFKFSQTEEYKKFHKDNALTEAFMDGPTFAKWMEDKGQAMQGTLKEIGLQKK